jgi:hypothetical protein
MDQHSYCGKYKSDSCHLSQCFGNYSEQSGFPNSWRCVYSLLWKPAICLLTWHCSGLLLGTPAGEFKAAVRDQANPL